MRNVRFILLIVLIAFAVTACASNPYQLPPPPPEDQWIDDAADPKAEERKREMLYLEARTTILGLFNLLSNQRYEEASKMVSSETRDFLTGGGNLEFADVLASGKLELGNGEVVELNPVSTLVAPDLTGMVDSVEGIGENETDSRKELFVPVEGGFQRVVMIKEGGAWVLHRTRLPQPIQPK